MNKFNKKKIFFVVMILIGLFLTLYACYKLEVKVPCFIYEYTRFYCPSCGITRMFKSIFKLELYKAFRYNPLIFILFFPTSIYFIYAIYRYITNKKPIIISFKYIIIFVIIMIVYGVLRNISYFNYLAPTVID